MVAVAANIVTMRLNVARVIADGRAVQDRVGKLYNSSEGLDPIVAKGAVSNLGEPPDIDTVIRVVSYSAVADSDRPELALDASGADVVADRAVGDCHGRIHVIDTAAPVSGE